MSTSDPQRPVGSNGHTPPRTQEIPVVQPAGATATHQLPPHPNATTPPVVQPVAAPAPTGPVDFVLGLPGTGTPPPPPAAAPPPVPPPSPAPPTAPSPAATWTAEPSGRSSGQRAAGRVPAPRNRSALVGLGLTALSLLLLELGLLMRGGDEGSYWDTIPLWSVFATVCAALGLLAFAAFFPAGNRRRTGPAWRVAAAGLVGLAVFWLLVVLPVVDTDRGFVLTAALAALGGALWVGPRRRD